MTNLDTTVAVYDDAAAAERTGPPWKRPPRAARPRSPMRPWSRTATPRPSLSNVIPITVGVRVR